LPARRFHRIKDLQTCNSARSADSARPDHFAPIVGQRAFCLARAATEHEPRRNPYTRHRLRNGRHPVPVCQSLAKTLVAVDTFASAATVSYPSGHGDHSCRDMSASICSGPPRSRQTLAAFSMVIWICNREPDFPIAPSPAPSTIRLMSRDYRMIPVNFGQIPRSGSTP
jgi:hypothetical protein